MRNSDDLPLFDAVVIGGGPAGLQAALTLGRMHLRTVLFDSGEYRNATVDHAHNLVTNDGRPPAELRRIARTELEAYATVEVRDAAVHDVAADGPTLDGDPGTSFTVTSADGTIVRTRAVLLATGMSDTLPDVPGLVEHWGGRVAQCPFCHGHELAGQPIAVVGEGAHVDAVRGMLARISDEITAVAPADLVQVAEIGEAALELTLDDGSTLRVGGVFIAAAAQQRSPFAERLGCAMLGSGAVEIDAMGSTSVPGVYAAGDMAHSAALPGPMVSLAAAIASGQLAAVSVVRASLVT